MSKRAPLLPWSKAKWSNLWCSIRRMSSRAIPRTKFVLLKSPASTLYEERYGGDLHVFTVSMYCNRMMGKGISVGMAIDCTSLDLHLLDEDILQQTLSKKEKNEFADKPTTRYWHDTNEWDDFDVEYQSINPKAGKVDAHFVVPCEETISKFITMCNDHWKRRPNTYIAVFDARGGIGAAAFLVSCFMCRRLKAPVHVAIASIQTIMQESGSTGIYDENLLRYLQKTFYGRRELVVPERPKWAPAIATMEAEEDENEADSNEKKSIEKIIIPPYQTEPVQKMKSSPSSSMLPPPPKKAKLVPSTNNDSTSSTHQKSNALMAVLPTSSKYARAMTVVAQLTNNKLKKESHSQFQKPLHLFSLYETSNNPNSKISFLKSMESLNGAKQKILSKNPYMVTWIPSGESIQRGYLLLLHDGIYFLSTKNGTIHDGEIDVQIVTKKLFFPCPTKPSQPQHRTILDGFFAYPIHGNDRTNTQETHSKLLFYTFDIISLEGGVVHHKPLGKRIAYLKGGVLDAKNKWAQHNEQKQSAEDIELVQLEFGEIKNIQEIWKLKNKNASEKSNGDNNGHKSNRNGGLLFMNMETNDGGNGFVWKDEYDDVSIQDLIKVFE